MKTVPLRIALAIALGSTPVVSAIAQDAPSPQQQELDAARSALDAAAKRYAELAARQGGDTSGRSFRFERDTLRKPVIGVVLAPDDRGGVRIAGVTPDSAAASAGLKSGDRLVSIDGKRVDAGAADARVDQARGLLAALDAKNAVALGYERDGKPATVSVTPKVGDRVLVVPSGMTFDGDVRMFVHRNGESFDIEADRLSGATPVARAAGTKPDDAPRNFTIAPDVRREIIRLGSDCKGKDCKLPALAEALRWSGLNLAAVDAQLGRYFGTDTGVLVLSAGKDLDPLQGGDVILKIAGKAVVSPREAMELLRAQPADGKVAVDYLRDRRSASAQLAVPAAQPFQAKTLFFITSPDAKKTPDASASPL